MSNENEIEIKCVFGLLDPANTKEIHVQQINNLVHSLEKLGPGQRRSKILEKPVEEANQAKVKVKSVREPEKRNSAFMISKNRPVNKRNSIFSQTNDTNLDNEKNRNVETKPNPTIDQ